MALMPFEKRGRNDLARLHSEMDDLFRAFFGGWEMPLSGHKFWPAINIADEENARGLTAVSDVTCISQPMSTQPKSGLYARLVCLP